MQNKTKTSPYTMNDGIFPLQYKILYWGPGEAGKTTNYKRLLEFFHEYKVSDGFSIETLEHRTLWNDHIVFKFPIPKYHLDYFILVSTTTGQERFLTTREYILQNSDGIIFVADSSYKKMEENKRSFEELLAYLNNRDIPILILLNKRDLNDAIELNEFLNIMKLPKLVLNEQIIKLPYESIATSKSNYGDIKLIFWDLIQIILKRNLMNN